MRIFRVYSELDVNCIENAWKYNTTEKWMANLDTARECFTDETSESQVVGSGLTVCHRPTVRRLIDDLNKSNFQYYVPVYDGACHLTRVCQDQSLMSYAATCLAIIGEHLEIEGCEAFA